MKLVHVIFGSMIGLALLHDISMLSTKIYLYILVLLVSTSVIYYN
jgi:hypothetical protein